VFVSTEWGHVVTDARFPRVWESNRAAVLSRHASVTLAEIRRWLLPALRAAGAAYEVVEFWDPPARAPALRSMLATAEDSGRDVMMVFRGGRDDAERAVAKVRRQNDPSITVRELVDPRRSFWKVYRDSRLEFGADMTTETLRQLVRRDRDVLVPAGLRLFGGYVVGELAGFSSLLSLSRVGYVDNVVTLPAFRRRGVASAVTTWAVRESLGSGDRATMLLAEHGGAPQRLYERLGFGVHATVVTVTNKLQSER
jgi:ribosomal protein S18 acetylase RimI-like enzyme